MNPVKQQHLRVEIQYLLDNDFIEPSQTYKSSPCIPIPKPDETFCMCIDYRKVNSVVITDNIPIPRNDANYASLIFKNDSGKFRSQISPLLLQTAIIIYKIVPFEMRNSSVTFQRLINGLIADPDGCKAYMDAINNE